MLTGMTERDWLIALEVFDAVQSSRAAWVTTVNSWRRSTISRSTVLAGEHCPMNLATGTAYGSGSGD